MAAPYKTPQARRDIYEALLQIALDNATASAALKEGLEARLQTLADNPEMGVARPEFGRSVRFFPFVKFSASCTARVILKSRYSAIANGRAR
jgi:plasmid stabilization system protein ParE